jgi:hypothetical protein
MNRQSTRARMAVVVVVSVVLAACSSAGPGSASAGPSASALPPSPSVAASGTELSVTSTLAGLTELPRRIHWEATPVGSVTEVDFLIDGQLGEVEHAAPYFYGGDGNWLVTSFLAPGPHTFVTKAIAPGGQTATETVNATVAVAPAPPADIAGHWTRSPTGSTLGVWSVTINSIGWLFDDPQGGGQNQDVEYPAKGKMITHGAIDEPPFPDPRGGAFCGDPFDPDGAFSYTVSADGSKLTVTADTSACDQGAFAGPWTKAS